MNYPFIKSLGAMNELYVMDSDERCPNRDAFVFLPNLEKSIEEAIHDALHFFEKKCPYCEKELFSGSIRNKIHVDHFIALHIGGQNVPWNILPVCAKCNSKKGRKRPNIVLADSVFSKCEKYLNSVRIRYVGSLQEDLEKFQQIKSLLNEAMVIGNISPDNHSRLVGLLCRIVFGVTPTEPKKNGRSPVQQNPIVSAIISKYKLPDTPFYPVVKLTGGQLRDYVESIVGRKLSTQSVGRVLKEMGFAQTLEFHQGRKGRYYTLQEVFMGTKRNDWLNEDVIVPFKWHGVSESASYAHHSPDAVNGESNQTSRTKDDPQYFTQ